jgi:hypothetical protein
MRAEENAEDFDFSIDGHILMENLLLPSERSSVYSEEKIEEKIKKGCLKRGSEI